MVMEEVAARFIGAEPKAGQEGTVDFGQELESGRERNLMSKSIAINQPAPDFALEDFRGHPFRLSERFGKRNVILIFNRGFA